MLNLFLCKNIVLPEARNQPYQYMTCDGHFLYLGFRNLPIIYKTDLDGCLVCEHALCKCYEAMCYDSVENCFWALPPKKQRCDRRTCPSCNGESTYTTRIFKLNACLQPEGSFLINNGGNSFCSIAFCCERNSLVLQAASRIKEFSKCGKLLAEHTCSQLAQCCYAAITDDIIISCCRSKNDTSWTIRMDSGCYAEDIACIPNQYEVDGICVIQEKCGFKYLYILASKKDAVPILSLAQERLHRSVWPGRIAGYHIVRWHNNTDPGAKVLRLFRPFPGKFLSCDHCGFCAYRAKFRYPNERRFLSHLNIHEYSQSIENDLPVLQSYFVENYM